jgi:hypothetical protein
VSRCRSHPAGRRQQPEAGQQTKTVGDLQFVPEQHAMLPVQTSPFEHPPASVPAQVGRQARPCDVYWAHVSVAVQFGKAPEDEHASVDAAKRTRNCRGLIVRVCLGREARGAGADNPNCS